MFLNIIHDIFSLLYILYRMRALSMFVVMFIDQSRNTRTTVLKSEVVGNVDHKRRVTEKFSVGTCLIFGNQIYLVLLIYSHEPFVITTTNFY